MQTFIKRKRSKTLVFDFYIFFCFNECLITRAYKKFNMDILVKMNRFQIKQNTLTYCEIYSNKTCLGNLNQRKRVIQLHVQLYMLYLHMYISKKEYQNFIGTRVNDLGHPKEQVWEIYDGPYHLLQIKGVRSIVLMGPFRQMDWNAFIIWKWMAIAIILRDSWNLVYSEKEKSVLDPVHFTLTFVLILSDHFTIVHSRRPFHFEV